MNWKEKTQNENKMKTRIMRKAKKKNYTGKTQVLSSGSCLWKIKLRIGMYENFSMWNKSSFTLVFTENDLKIKLHVKILQILQIYTFKFYLYSTNWYKSFYTSWIVVFSFLKLLINYFWINTLCISLLFVCTSNHKNIMLKKFNMCA